MKCLALLLLVTLVAATLAIEMTPEMIQNVKSMRKHCMEHTHVDHELVKKFAHGDFEEDEKLKLYMLCFFKKAGVMNEAGDFLKDEIKTKTTTMFGEDTSAKIMEHCIHKEGVPMETAFKYAKCTHQYWPTNYPKA